MPTEVTLHVSNLHCGSCTRVIEECIAAVSPKPLSVQVSVAQQTVRVVYDSAPPLEAIQAALLDEGFDLSNRPLGIPGRLAIGVSSSSLVTLQGRPGRHQRSCLQCGQYFNASVSSTLDLTPVNTRTMVEKKSKSDFAPYPYKLILSIGGMTCSACTRAINDTVIQIPGVSDIVISLIDNAATVILDNETLADTVSTAIEDCGFEVRVVSLEPYTTEAVAQGEEVLRTVALKVDGMLGPECPKKVMSVLQAMDPSITIVKPLITHTDPVLEISYAPRIPSFSIRDIISGISVSSNPPFRVTVHHPPTLEELSRAVRLRERRNILFKLIFSIVAAIPTLIIGVVYMTLVKDGNPQKAYLMEPMWAGNASRIEWALFFLATPVMFYSANTFHTRSLKEIKALWRPGSSVPLWKRFVKFGSMNLLVSSGVSVAYFSSLALLIVAATSTPGGESDNTTYFDAVVFLTMFLLIGRFMEAVSKARTADAITALSSLRPAEALLVVPNMFSPATSSPGELEKGGTTLDDSNSGAPPGTKVERVSVDLLEVGDMICVPNGATPPADGTIVEGEKSIFDESSLTGESRPVTKESGEQIFVGTINKGRMVHIKVDAIGGKTMLDNIVKVVREGQIRRAPIERVADIITGYFVPVITLLAIITWIVWLALGYSGVLPDHYLDIRVGGWAVWSLRFAIAVFVVACPCGIGLAAPTALLVGMGLAAKNGILARGGGEAFQEMSQLNVIVFDKTGTLTEGGEPQVSNFMTKESGRWTNAVIKGISAELEDASSHPLAIAIRNFCREGDTPSFTASDVEEVAGRGLKATFRTLQCVALIGNENWIHEHGAVLDKNLVDHLETWKSQGKSIVITAISDEQGGLEGSGFQVVAAFAISDALRPEAPEVVSWYQKQGIDTWMISGDNVKTARAVAALVGIPASNVIAGVLPHEKSEKVQWLQQSHTGKRHNKAGRTVVAMVGDGINDAPALAAADVGIAIGSGSDVAISSAGFVLLSSNLRSLITLRDLSKRVINRVIFNFIWALMYNMIAVPIAAGVIFPANHARLDPVWASLAMALSSCSVVASSLFLKLYKAPKSAMQEVHSKTRESDKSLA
ncbi:hypothetical protein AMATHDRAFT_1765 [Amanita thiersii Skay4041]|uniref:HMA domain-containing protein n=1 Tax=Amanita thiersii Skay4041 TaxID=703135 RepID=A0A2A9NXP6_9AGAR|nr:hypothetical protein AMATHDRAFT_1765 [Amanita thiersii Skay4041]